MRRKLLVAFLQLNERCVASEAIVPNTNLTLSFPSIARNGLNPFQQPGVQIQKRSAFLLRFRDYWNDLHLLVAPKRLSIKPLLVEINLAISLYNWFNKTR